MLKRLSGILLIIFLSAAASAQIYNPVTWDYTYVKTGDNQFELRFTATIEEGSHIYGMDIPEGGPIPTSFRIDSAASYNIEGAPFTITEPVEKFDEAFTMDIKTYSETAEFGQKISGNAASFKVTGAVMYMACNNKTCSPPQEIEFEINVSGGTAVEKQGRGLLGFFLIAMLAGFAGVLTPCVFPMIPMTVAFFSQGSENRGKAVMKAVVFGLSIMLIYSSLGLIVSLLGTGPGFAQALSTHWLPNTLFFLLFVTFAISFLGAFEIVLPSSWATGADSKVDRGGLVGSFFMGLTTVIVSFSCTGPIIGALLVEAATGDVLRPTIGMIGFGLAFALPFTVFALFPSVMSKIPKSGGWLNSVKVVLAFIMLAFSMKFLMTVDSVYQLGIISRDVFIAVWIVLFTLLGFYLLGKIKFSHDSDLPFIGTFRIFLVIIVFSFVVYLIPGMFGSPLTGIAYFMPSGEPELNIPGMLARNQVVAAAPASDVAKSEQCEQPKHGDFLKMPLGLTGYFDYKQGLACAREMNKPVFLDFKGHACANCKLMEARVWSDPEVLRLLREEFVIVALYLDDRTTLPEEEWVTSKIDGKVKKTIGKVNEDLEISKFRTNAMPLYVITDHEGNPVNEPMPTNLNVAEYKAWLEDGIRKFNQL